MGQARQRGTAAERREAAISMTAHRVRQYLTMEADRRRRAVRNDRLIVIALIVSCAIIVYLTGQTAP